MPCSIARTPFQNMLFLIWFLPEHTEGREAFFHSPSNAGDTAAFGKRENSARSCAGQSGVCCPAREKGKRKTPTQLLLYSFCAGYAREIGVLHQFRINFCGNVFWKRWAWGQGMGEGGAKKGKEKAKRAQKRKEAAGRAAHGTNLRRICDPAALLPCLCTGICV